MPYAELASKEVADEAREPSVAIGKRMDGDEAMAEPYGGFIGRKGPMLDPIARIVDELPDVHRDAIGVNADVPRGRAIRPASLS